MASAAAATHPKTLSSLPESALRTFFGGTWFDGAAAPWNLFEPASQARLASAARVHAPAAVRSPLPHQLGYDECEEEAHVHVRLHNMPHGARVCSSASGATLHIDTGKGAKSHAGSTPSGGGSPGDPAFEIATHQFTGGMAGTSVHPANPHSAGANIAHRVPQKRAPQAASGSASPWSLDSLLHLPGKLIVAASTYEGRGLDTAVDATEHAVLSVGEKLGLVKASAAPKPSGPRKPGMFEQYNHAFASTVVGGVENMIGGLWNMESYAYQHPIDFYTGVGKRLWELKKWEFNTDKKILTAAYHAAVESTTARGRQQLWNDGVRTWHDSVRTAEGLWNRTSNAVSNAYKAGTLPTLAGHAAGEVFLVVAPALVGAPEVSAARIGGSLALKEGVEVGAKTVLKEAATETAEASVAKGAAEKAGQIPSETLSSNPTSLERRLGTEDVPEPEPKPKVKKEGPETFSASLVRFSQESVSYFKKRGLIEYTYDDILKGMLKDGWQGDPIDVVEMEDGGLTSVDNTRVTAAREAGIDVKANVHHFSDPLPRSQLRRFNRTKAKTWGEAVTRRMQGQDNPEFYKKNPYGSHDLPEITGRPDKPE